MRDIVIQKIEDIINIVYSVDKNGVDKAFMELIDHLLKLVEEENLTNSLEFNKILMELQVAYEKKDLVDLADVLNYQLKLFLE